MGKELLVVADVDQIQSYVFASNRLRAIRGASLVIGELDEALRTSFEKHGGDCYRSIGGALVGKLDAAQKDAFYTDASQIAYQIGGAALSVTFADTHFEEDFPKALSSVFEILREKKNNQKGRPFGNFEFGGGFVRQCEVCHQYPSQPHPTRQSEEFYLFGDTPRFICESCWKRLGGNLATRMDKTAQGFYQALSNPMIGVEWQHEKMIFPSDMEGLWDKSVSDQDARYLAFMVADGNAIGRLVEVLDDARLYQEFSTAFPEVINSSLAFAAKQSGILDLDKGQVQLSPIISGGDDLSVLLPAKNVFTFAGSFVLAFETFSKTSRPIQDVIKKFKEKYPENPYYPNNLKAWSINMAVGIVVAKPHFPISSYYRLARQLRSNAKAKYPYQSSIDFIVVTAAMAEDLQEMSEKYYRNDRNHPKARLTARPYSMDDYPLVLGAAHAMQEGLPRNRRKWLAQQIWAGIGPGEDAYHDSLKRMKGNERKKVIKYLEKMGIPRGDLFITVAGEHITPLLDILEMIDLFEEGEQEND